MLLYLLIVFLFFYHTNAHGIIMDFTLNTIIGEHECNDYANLVMRSCFFLTRANSKRLSLGWSFDEKKRTDENEEREGETGNGDEICVVSFRKKESKKTGNKPLGSGSFTFSDHRDSVIVHNNNQKNKLNIPFDEYDDDETASTVDMYEDEYSVSLSTKKNPLQSRPGRRVQFEDELVTAVYTRPRTTKDDKYYLHYDEYDYIDFKLEYRDDLLIEQQRKHGQSSKSNPTKPIQRATNYRRSPRKVSFKRDVVDSVHPVMDRNQRNKILSDLFYTEEEMRTFLDEFVASLQKQSMQKPIPSS